MPYCDFCMILYLRKQKARVDGALNAEGRALAEGHSWANMCKKHHKLYGVGIGMGKGRYIT